MLTLTFIFEKWPIFQCLFAKNKHLSYCFITVMKDYELIKEQLKNILDKDLPLVSNLSNASAIINQLDDLNWCGFYLVQDDKLVLGPFQGEPACTIIPKGNGVCGTAFAQKKTIVVDDVNLFKGHIACSSLSKSEIVIPLIINNEVKAVLDIDAPIYNRFDKNDKVQLEIVAEIIEEVI